MNEEALRISPQALAEYLVHRYRVQHGHGLCLVLGRLDASDNFQALSAWVLDAIKRHSGVDLCEQVQTIEKELCRLMVDAGIVEEDALDYAAPAGLIAGIFERTSASAAARTTGRARRSRTGPYSENIVPFPIRPSQN